LPDHLARSYGGEVRLRALLGPQDDCFTPAALVALFEVAWKVTPRNDRMGYRLEGPPLAHAGGADLVSDALGPGAIQVPGDGQPIVLGVDAQTTGGYPKIAWVIGADLPALAQARSGAALRFVRCSEDEAVEALRQARAELSRVAALVAAERT
jgi:allophanate hydrolase subunit 2